MTDDGAPGTPAPEETERDREAALELLAAAGWLDDLAEPPEQMTVVVMDSKDYGWLSGPC